MCDTNKIQTTLTELIFKVEAFGGSLNKQEEHNKERHAQVIKRLMSIEGTVNDHESRIAKMEGAESVKVQWDAATRENIHDLRIDTQTTRQDMAKKFWELAKIILPFTGGGILYELIKNLIF